MVHKIFPKPIWDLLGAVWKKFPYAGVRVDPPLRKNGFWYIDFDVHEAKWIGRATIEWRPKKGYGISYKKNPGLGEGPDEVYRYLPSAAKRLFELLKQPVKPLETK